jgi:hypothetical protein
MQSSRVPLLRSAIVLVVCAGFINQRVHKGALAQSSDPPSISRKAEREKGLLTWLAGPPVGLLLGNLAGQPAAVEAVQAGTAADHAGLHQGDILERVGDLDIPSSDRAAEHINNAWTAGKSAIDLVVSRAGHEFYVVLRLHD